MGDYARDDWSQWRAATPELGAGGHDERAKLAHLAFGGSAPGTWRSLWEKTCWWRPVPLFIPAAYRVLLTAYERSNERDANSAAP